MKDHDPNFAHLNITCEKIMYDTYCQHQPDMVKQLEFLIRKGYTPTDIENFARSVAPKGSQVADHIYLIASHLFRNTIPAN